jgi:hypothetical protein
MTLPQYFHYLRNQGLTGIFIASGDSFYIVGTYNWFPVKSGVNDNAPS